MDTPAGPSIEYYQKPDLVESKEQILESKDYKLTKDNKTYNISVKKTQTNLIIRYLNYENRMTNEYLRKLTNQYLNNINESYNFIKQLFDDDRIIIKDIEIKKVFILQIIIFDFKGQKNYIDINLDYSKENKDFTIEELSMRCNALEEEVSELKNEIKGLKEQINDINSLKEEILKLKEIINIPSNKEIKLNNPLNLIEEISNNSYSDWGLDNVFTAFTSIENIHYLTYYTKENTLIFYSLDEKKAINIAKKPHDNFITNIHHIYDKKGNQDIIMTVSAENNNIKLWTLKKFKIILDFKSGKKGKLLSVSFLNFNNNNYIITSNGDLDGNEFEPIKIYDFRGKKIMTIKKSNINTNFITSFYDNETSINYILTGNDGFINSYELNENAEPKIFKDSLCQCSHRSVAILYSEAIYKLMASSDDGIFRIWNFYTGILIKTINAGNSPLRGICTLNEKYIFVGSKDKTIKLIDIKEGVVKYNKEGHKNTVLAIKLINLKDYGDCLISQGMRDDCINLWEINYK